MDWTRCGDPGRKNCPFPRWEPVRLPQRDRANRSGTAAASQLVTVEIYIVRQKECVLHDAAAAAVLGYLIRRNQRETLRIIPENLIAVMPEEEDLGACRVDFHPLVYILRMSQGSGSVVAFQRISSLAVFVPGHLVDQKGICLPDQRSHTALCAEAQYLRFLSVHCAQHLIFCGAIRRVGFVFPVRQPPPVVRVRERLKVIVSPFPLPKAMTLRIKLIEFFREIVKSV